MMILHTENAVCREDYSHLLDDIDENERTLLGRPRILVVDDDEDQLAFYCASLKRAGYDVIPTQSATEALEIIAKKSVACILCDLYMPELDGRNFVRKLRKCPKLACTPVIMMTAGTPALEFGLLASGADMFFQKSTPLHKLIEQIELLLW